MTILFWDIFLHNETLSIHVSLYSSSSLLQVINSQQWSTFLAHPVHGLQSIVSFLPTVAELCMHGDFCKLSSLNINVDFIKLFDWINCIKMFVSGWAGSAQTLCGVQTPDPLESPREGREERRIEEGREVVWTPKDVWQMAAIFKLFKTIKTKHKTRKCVDMRKRQISMPSPLHVPLLTVNAGTN